MKQLFILTALVLPLTLVAQTKKPASKPASTTKTSTTSKPAAKPATSTTPKDTKAKFPGGTEALDMYFAETKDIEIKYRRNFDGDTCKLQLSISATGKVTKATVVRPTKDCDVCDTAYVQHALEMPSWKPATSKDKAVASKQNYTIVIHPLTMEAEDSETFYVSEKASEGFDDVFEVAVPREVEVPRGEDEPLEFPDEFAEFPGGVSELQSYLMTNIKIPASAKENNVSGKVYLRFIVEKDGSITNVQTQRGIPDCPDCSTEAIRVVRSMPKWRPAKKNGKVVRSYFNLPVKFVTN